MINGPPRRLLQQARLTDPRFPSEEQHRRALSSEMTLDQGKLPDASYQFGRAPVEMAYIAGQSSMAITRATC
jgi:hypothetical protein